MFYPMLSLVERNVYFEYLILQGKASCMVAAALCPEPGWVVSCFLLLFLMFSL